MEFSLEKSIVNDVIGYFLVYFNKDKIIQNCIELSRDIKKRFKFYDSINLDFKIENDYLALFAIENNSSAVMDYILYSDFDLINSIDDFISVLQSPKRVLEVLSGYYFNEVRNDDSITVSDVFKLNIDSNVKTSIALILNDVDGIVSKLTCDLRRINKLMIELYSNNTHEINKLIKKHDHCFVNFLLNNTANLRYYGITFCLPFSYLYNDSTVMYGYYVEEIIANENNNKYIYITKSNIANIVNDKLALEYIKLFIDNGFQLSRTQIFQRFHNYIKQSVNRVISNLLTLGIISCSELVNGDMHYILNLEFFNHAAKIDLEAIRKVYPIIFKNVSYKSFAGIISNSVMVEILNIIKKAESINPSGILKILNEKYSISHPSIYRMINTLNSEGIIYVSKRNRKMVYYSVSMIYLDYIENNFKDFIRELKP